MCLHVHAGLFKPQGIVRTPLTLLSFAMWRGLAPFAGCCKTLGEGVKYKTYLLCWLLQGGQFAWRAITNCAVLQVKKNHLLRHKWQNGKKGNIFIDLPKCKMYRNTSVSGVVRGKGREGGRERERERNFFQRTHILWFFSILVDPSSVCDREHDQTSNDCSVPHLAGDV